MYMVCQMLPVIWCLDYLKDWCQTMNVIGISRTCIKINRDVKHGSVVSQLLRNIYLNDLFYVGMNCLIANYADDNCLYYANSCMITLRNILENDTKAAIGCYENYYRDSKLDKFWTEGLMYHSPSLCRKTSNDHHRVLGIILGRQSS